MDPEVEISDDRKRVTILKCTDETYRFNATWLRHHCQCEECRHPVSGMRRIDPTDLAPLYSVKGAHVQDDELVVEFNEEAHTVRIPLSYLAENSYSKEARDRRIRERIPDTPKCQGEIPKVQNVEVLSSDQGLWRWLKHLNEEGMCLLQGIPPNVPIKQTFSTFNEDMNNIGYTTYPLAAHMDMAYQESCPGYQFMRCERFDDCVTGGESILVDAWYEARCMQELYPDDFDILTRVPVCFYNVKYASDRVDMRFRGPHFIVDKESGEIIAITISPVVQGPLLIPEDDVEPYYKAYHKYYMMLKESKTKVEFRLKEGEMMCFNNRRITHARNGFTLNGGKRVFTGCYLSCDDVRSRTQLLANEFNGGKPVKLVFNRSSL